MPDYNWTCHACSSVNEAGSNECSKCGLSAIASAEEIELHSTPGAYKRKKAIEKYQKPLLILVMFPLFAVKFSMNGNSLMLLSIVFIYTSNSELLSYIWKNKWASNTLLIWSGSILALIVIRFVVISKDSSLIGYLAFIFMAVYFSMSYYFFKSEKGKQFFSEYYEKANQQLSTDSGADAPPPAS